MMLAAVCGAIIIGAIALYLSVGIPGFTGGTSPSQQQTSGAPQPTNEIRDGTTRENTGWGAPKE